ncbi:diguanylate cyclase domain-containing protein [Halomonas denitrificans]|nr:diguanylate cyclase [Halomonas denitrificans]
MIERARLIQAVVLVVLCGVLPVRAQEPAGAPAAAFDLQLAELEARAGAEGFAAVRASFETLIERPDLPVESRSLALRRAISAAREARDPGFHEPAERFYRVLYDALPAGPERSNLTQHMANIEIDRGRFAEAEAMYLQADAEGADRPLVDRANLMTALGVARAQQGNLAEALEAMLEGYARYERTESGPSPNLLRNIGGLSIYLEDYEQAIEFTRRAIDALGPDHPDTPGSYSNLAAALVELGRSDRARSALREGIAIADRQQRPNASLLSNLGFLQFEGGDLDAALATFERTAELNRAAGDTGALAITFKNMGEVRVAMGLREQGAEAFDRSLALYREADIKPKRLELYPPLVENLEALGRFPEALERMREWQDLAAELASADAQSRVAELQTVFDLQQRERELSALQAERSRQRLVGWGLLVGLVVLALFILALGRNLRLRTRAHRLLAEKNAEIDAQREALARANSLLHRLSHADELTGLDNRRGVHRRITPDRPGPLQKDRALAVLIDLDRFKQINDRFGHPAGDRVLSRFAAILRDVAGPGDVLARWGGEEFLWLVAGAGPGEVAEVCNRLLERVRAARFDIEGRSIAVTCSLGCAPMDLRGDAPEDEFSIALRLADAALYEAKQAGRDRWIALDRKDPSRDAYTGAIDTGRLLDRGALARIEG